MYGLKIPASVTIPAFVQQVLWTILKIFIFIFVLFLPVIIEKLFL
jgi:hypothetical protein